MRCHCHYYGIWARSWDVIPMITLHYLRLHLVSKLALEVPYALLHLKKQASMNLKAAKKMNSANNWNEPAIKSFLSCFGKPTNPTCTLIPTSWNPHGTPA